MTDTVNTYQEPDSTATAEHDAEMIQKAEQAEQAGTERPDWLPEKFKSAEDMVKAYAELEKKLGSKPQPEPEETPEETKEEPTPDTEAAEVAKALDNAGLDFNTLQDEYANNGGLTEDSYKSLEEKGFTRDLVDSWIAGQEAIANNTTQQIFNEVGGEEQYSAMLEWASQNLNETDVNAFNKAIDSGDIDVTRLAVQGLSARYRSEVGTEPKLVQGDGVSSTGGTFNSAAELTAAMSDPRYHKDPAYRQSVAAKLAKSNVF